MIKWIKLISAIVICEAAGAIGAIFTARSVDSWYVTLNKPFFTPPNWLFAPVWIILYAMMGISAFLIWRKGVNQKAVRIALIYFGLQLFANTLWSSFFFGMRSPVAGLVDILILTSLLIVTIYKFFPLSKTAGFLLIPYLIWLVYATALNAAILILN